MVLIQMIMYLACPRADVHHTGELHSFLVLVALISGFVITSMCSSRFLGDFREG
jgi:hypothetical protein